MKGPNHFKFNKCQHSSLITSIKDKIITNLSMYENHLNHYAYKEVCSELSDDKNSRCEGQQRRINSVVQESQTIPDPIRWMKLLI